MTAGHTTKASGSSQPVEPISNPGCDRGTVDASTRNSLPADPPRKSSATSNQTGPSARPSAKTESPVAAAGMGSKQQPADARPPSKKKQQDDVAMGMPSDTAVVEKFFSSSSSSSSSDSRNITSNDVRKPPLKTIATDGYISFSESESEMLATPPVPTPAKPQQEQQQQQQQHRSPKGEVPHDDHHGNPAAGGARDQRQQDRKVSSDSVSHRDGGDDDDKWDFGDEDSDRAEQQSARSAGIRSAPVGSDGGANVGAAGEPEQVRVAVDILGRRKNDPKR